MSREHTIVRFIFHDGRGGEIQNLSYGISDFIPRFKVIHSIPETNNIFVLPNADGTTTDLWPVIDRNFWRIELVANDGEHDILPQPVRHTLLEPEDPFSAGQV